MNAPLVSILIPCRNSAPWLEETLHSCLAQTHCNLEIILVDDASTDQSAELARRVASNDARLQVHTQAPGGACRARKRAFELSHGEYIQYLDADDLLHPNKIASQLDVMRRTGAKLSNGPWAILRELKG